MNTTKPTIKQLRQSGWKVRVMHTRDRVPVVGKISGEGCTTLSNFGGYTRIECTPPGTEATYVGEAHCSDEDNFNRRIGNSIALGRAYQQFLNSVTTS